MGAAGVDAIDDRASARVGFGSVIAAALMLPSVVAAQFIPAQESGAIGFRWLSYQDWQPGLDRINVSSPSFMLRVPVSARWSVEGTLVADSVSGASPRYHTAVSGASRMSDQRRAGDIRVTRYNDRNSWSVGAAASNENDFRSRAISAQASWATDDNNRSWSFGVALIKDRIGSTDAPTLDEKRSTVDLAAGLTQALSRTDLVQLAVTYADGRGYYSDPYKSPDFRPAVRRQTSLNLRWNHHVEDWDTTLRTSYRRYRDSFGVRSHTLVFEPIIALGPSVQIAPSLRLYSQDAASFYYNPVYSYSGTPYPPGYFDAPPAYISADQRLAAFGAVTVGLRVEVALGAGWTTDFKIERYEQNSAWHLIQPGSRGLAPLYANIMQWGLMRQF